MVKSVALEARIVQPLILASLPAQPRARCLDFCAYFIIYKTEIVIVAYLWDNTCLPVSLRGLNEYVHFQQRLTQGKC